MPKTSKSLFLGFEMSDPRGFSFFQCRFCSFCCNVNELVIVMHFVEKHKGLYELHKETGFLSDPNWKEEYLKKRDQQKQQNLDSFIFKVHNK
ncbi:MAG: hypothetical protein ACFFDF_24900 [Candidatus Odinarchaeota archaeon]